MSPNPVSLHDLWFSLCVLCDLCAMLFPIRLVLALEPRMKRDELRASGATFPPTTQKMEDDDATAGTRRIGT